MEKTGAKVLQKRADVEAELTKLGIAFKAYSHNVCLNMKDIAEHVKLDHAPAIKNLCYVDKKDNFYLIIAKADTQINKPFWKKLGTTSGNVRMPKEDVLAAILGITMPGSVNAFALLNDKEAHKVHKFVVDKNLLSCEYWAFHPMENNASIEVKRDEFLTKFVKGACGIDHVELDLSETEEAPAGEEKKEVKKEEKKPAPVHHDEKEGETKLGIDYGKAENFPMWYVQTIIKAQMIEYYDISGCYILRPWAYAIWEEIQRTFDAWIKLDGVENAYFPVFVSEKALNREKDHVEGFAPEVAWVTKYGTSDLKEPIAIRPTSETIMYPSYAKWISSHRDLPLKLNQWTNVVRWEFKHPTPFIRTREFLWQEGHTAHATLAEAEKQVYDILELYRRVYEEVLAVPVVKGIKTEGEKFAGGYYTTTVETWIPTSGRGVQAATSHNLGQNFSKMFDVKFENEKKETEFAWQTSWGLTTRSIGVVVMIHGDDKGLVLPPRASRHQVVIIPVIFKESAEQVATYVKAIIDELRAAGIRAHLDDRDNYSPGWKYNHWEQKGVPLRLEVGPKDIAAGEVRAVRRFDGAKSQMKREAIAATVTAYLEEIQAGMFNKAKEALDSKKKIANDWPTFMKEINGSNVVMTPWCKETPCEEKVKERSGIESKQMSAAEAEVQLTGSAKTLCMPLKQDPIAAGEVCFHCGKPAKTRVLWGRSY